MRIIQALIGGRQLTPQQLIKLLPDIPQATLYRHLNKLSSGGIITIVDQRKVRGTVEKVYSLVEQEVSLTKNDLESSSRDDHLRYFLAFLATIQADFERYLQQDQFDMEKDGFGYRQVSLYLNDEEFLQLALTISSAVQQALKNQPAPGRRRRTLSTIIIPEPKS